MSRNETLVDPVPNRATDKGTVLSERLSELEGASIGLLSNAKKNSDHFLESVGGSLERDYGATTSDVIYKPTATNAAPDDVYARLREYDAVLTAYGDCGSCSSWTIHDAIALERQGIPVVVFCSEEFSTLCQFEAENQTCPGLPIVEFEHPIADVSPEVVRDQRVTPEICEEVADALTTTPDALRERYEGRYTVEV